MPAIGQDIELRATIATYAFAYICGVGSVVNSRVDELRTKAKALYGEAEKIADADERLTVVLRALECEMEADALDREQGVTQVQQQGTLPPPPLPGSPQAQPVQQQQQVQPKTEE